VALVPICSYLYKMGVGLVIFELVGCMGLFAALRPENYARYFLGGISAQSALRQLQGTFIDGLVIFSVCTIAIIVLPFGSNLNFSAPVFSPLFFLVCAVAHVWWGVRLLRNPESFLKQTTEPWGRLPT